MKGSRPGSLAGGGAGHVGIRTVDPYDSSMKGPGFKDGDTTHYIPDLAMFRGIVICFTLFAFGSLLSFTNWLLVIASIDGLGGVTILLQYVAYRAGCM